MLRVSEIRKIMMAHQKKVDEEIARKQEETGKSPGEVLAEDPFLAGQAYMLGMIGLDFLIASADW
jgi:hypothetical protein